MSWLRGVVFSFVLLSILFVLPMVSALPDLVPINLKINYVQPYNNQSCQVSISASVLNQGNNSTIYNYSDRWIINGHDAATYYGRPALGAGGIDALPDFVFSTIAGFSSLSFETDYTHLITESSESNNIASLNFTCSPVGANHTECKNNACVLIVGPGFNSCTSNAQCVGNQTNSTNQTNQTHFACVNRACVLVTGAGANLCSSNSQCGGNQTNSTNQTNTNQTNSTTHLACVSNTCSVVSGAGNNTCSPQGSYCYGNQTHLECWNNACRTVAGAGSNQNGCKYASQRCTGKVTIPVNNTTNSTNSTNFDVSFSPQTRCPWFKSLFFLC